MKGGIYFGKPPVSTALLSPERALPLPYAEEYAKANNIPFEGISAYDVGDVNMDGRIDILDATLIQKYVVGIVELSAEQKHLADYNNDGDITVVDATEIQKFIVHLN